MKVKAEQNLIRLLRDNQDTDFGRAHGFREIEDADEYRRNVLHYLHNTYSLFLYSYYYLSFFYNYIIILFYFKYTLH